MTLYGSLNQTPCSFYSSHTPLRDASTSSGRKGVPGHICRQVEGLQDLSLASKSNYPPGVSCAFNSTFSAFLCHKSKDFFFQRNESEAFQKKICLVKNMRRDLISKKKRKNMQNCGIIVDWQMSEKKIATCLCSIAHLPAHTTKCITFATQRFICGRSELKPFHRQCSTSAHVPSEKCKFTLKSIINRAFAGDLQHRYQATGRKTKNYIRKTERYFFIFTHA